MQPLHTIHTILKRPTEHICITIFDLVPVVSEFCASCTIHSSNKFPTLKSKQPTCKNLKKATAVTSRQFLRISLFLPFIYQKGEWEENGYLSYANLIDVWTSLFGERVNKARLGAKAEIRIWDAWF